MAGNNPDFLDRLALYTPRPKQRLVSRDKTASDYFALGVVPPYALLCGLMVIAGMMALSGMLELAIAAGLITMIINYVRFGSYAPGLFSKFPRTLFYEIDEKGQRTEKPLSDNKRLFLMIIFVFGFSVISAAGLTLFSIMLMKEAFMNLGMMGVMSLGGYSLLPALIFFGAASFLCAWPMFADGASNMFARKDFWTRLKRSAQKFFVFIPDESLLLPDETLEEAGEHTLKARQLLRMVLVIGLIGLVAFGNFVVAQAGFGFIFSGATSNILGSLALAGGSIFIINVITQLTSLFVLALQFTWKQYMLPVDYKVNDNPALRYSLALLASPVLVPLLIVRGLMGMIVNEYINIQNTLVSPRQDSDNKGFFHDTDTVFEHIRCNTKNLYVNLFVNALIITPVTFVIGAGIFLSQHIKLFAFVNAISSGVTSFNSQSSALTNGLSIAGYGAGSFGFGMDGERIEWLNGQRQSDVIYIDEEPKVPNLTTVLFSFVMNPTNPKDTDLDSIHPSPSTANSRL